MNAIEYCEWAIHDKNGMVPHYVKLQCSQWLDIVDDNNEDAFFSLEMYEKLYNILHLMIHPDLQKPLDESLESYELLLL